MPADNPRGLCERPGARGNHVGDRCCTPSDSKRGDRIATVGLSF